MGDFIVDLLKYEDYANTADFLDKIYSNSLIPQMISNKNNTTTENVN